MNSNNPNSSPESWDKYWQGTGEAGAFSAGGASHPGVQVFWGDFFQSLVGRFTSPRHVDIATGNGAVVEMALNLLADDKPAITCVDISESAIRNAEARFPGAAGVVSDAAAIPLEDYGFDIVTSQFGIEYAGPDAVTEAARLVAPGGALALLMHIENGIVQKECEDSLAAIAAIKEADFIALATELFRNGFAAIRGADRAPYDAAGASFAPAVAAAEKVMDEYGDDVAGGSVAKLYNDVAQIHSRMPNYDPDEVLGWLSTMDAEMAAYGERMSSMIEAASSRGTIEEICAQLQSSGLKLSMANEILIGDDTLPLAWALLATRPE
jgi:SAM-dependent methyltransferase